MRMFDLNFVCRILEWLAVIVLVGGIFLSCYLGIDHGKINAKILIGGVFVSILDSMFWLFLSRIGDAVDDIRNLYVEESYRTAE